MSVFDDMFGDIFGADKDFDSGFGTKTKKTTTETVTQIYYHPNSVSNVSKIYTFARTISEIVLKPTKQGTYVILDCNGIILEEESEIVKAKIRYIKIVLGE